MGNSFYFEPILCLNISIYIYYVVYLFFLSRRSTTQILSVFTLKIQQCNFEQKSFSRKSAILILQRFSTTLTNSSHPLTPPIVVRTAHITLPVSLHVHIGERESRERERESFFSSTCTVVEIFRVFLVYTSLGHLSFCVKLR